MAQKRTSASVKFLLSFSYPLFVLGGSRGKQL